MIYLLISIIGILLTIAIVIGIHEFSHFMVARLLGVKVLRFSIGFGKKLFGWHDKKGTEYVIAMIPLGGYVKMLDESEESVAKKDLPLAYNRQPFYKKFFIVLAGPFSNLICAFCFYWLIFIIGFSAPIPRIGKVDAGSIAATAGLKSKSEILAIDNHETVLWPAVFFRIVAHAGDQDQLSMRVKNHHVTQTHILDLSNWSMDKLIPDPLGSLGLHPDLPEIPLVIGIIKNKSPAESLLKINDKLIAINQQKVTNWNEIVNLIETHPNHTLLLTIERQGKILKISVKTSYQFNTFFQKKGFLGIGPQIKIPANYLKTVQYTPGIALIKAWDEMVNFTYFNFMLIGKLMVGKISIQSLGGPITVFETAGEALNSGILSFLSFLAFINISIGILNLLPIPGLDGGHLFIQMIEAILGKPLPEKLIINLYRLGFLFILFIMLQTFINDILRL